ncbi:hypothetical protein EZS27_022282, partial [termite gut metagenome]
MVTEKLSETIGTKFSIKNLNVGFLLNRITLDNVSLKDKSDKDMVKVSRLSIKFGVIAALRGKISLSNVQLFGFDINLNRDNPETEPNFKFLIDALASEDTLKQSKTDLRINSLLMRRGRISYDVFSEKETVGKFNVNHINLHNITGNISLKTLKNDSLNVSVKRLSFDEQSGFELKKLSLHALGNEYNTRIEDLMINLPGTFLQTDVIRLSYDSIAVFKQFAQFADNVNISFKTLPSYLTLQDISSFVPPLANFQEKIHLQISADGSINQLGYSDWQISMEDCLKFNGSFFIKDLFSPANTYISGKVSEFVVYKEGTDFLFRNIKATNTIPILIKRLGEISFQGEIIGYFTDFIARGDFNTELGTVNANLKLNSDKKENQLSYSGMVQTERFELGKLLNNNSLSTTSFNMDIKGEQKEKTYPQIKVKGLIKDMEYNKYTYRDIALEGDYQSGGINGKIEWNDKNGAIVMNGEFNIAKERNPKYKFNADIKNIHPKALKLTSRNEDTELSLKIDADFAGTSINEITGRIHIDSISFISPDNNFFSETFNLLATTIDDKKRLILNSDFLKGTIEGTYSYATLPRSFMNVLHEYVPALTPDKSIDTGNNFSFDLHLFDMKFLSTIFNIPFTINTHSTLKGYFDAHSKRINMEGDFPSFQYQNKVFKNGMFFCGNPTGKLKGEIKFSNASNDTNKAMNISLIAQAKNDTVDITVDWENHPMATHNGRLSALTAFSRSKGHTPFLKTVIDVKETDITIGNEVWKVHPSQIIVADSGKVHVNNFYFSHENQYARVNGDVSKDDKDTIKVDLKDLNVGYIFNITNSKTNFDGRASGRAYLNRKSSGETIMKSQLFVKNLTLNNSILGDANIEGEWHPKRKAIYLDAKIYEQNISNSRVTGYIYPLKANNGLDLDIQADSLNIHFLEYYLKSFASNVHGRATGKVRLFGPFKTLDLEGSAKSNASMKINILNTTFAFNDSIRLKPSAFLFNNIMIHDTKEHYGIVDGSVHHQYLKNMNYRLNISSTNMLVMDLKEDTDLPFYGTVYGTGNVLLAGNLQGLNIDVAMTTMRGSNFSYRTKPTGAATSSSFIKFTDKTVQQDTEEKDADRNNNNEKNKPETMDKEEIPKPDTRLNIMVDATPEATIKLVLDPVSGDYISGNGVGSIRVEYYNKGDVKMFGNYNINQGIYKFNLQEVIRKDFLIKEGSNIVFNGDPLNATMNIQAVYTVNSASLNDLIPDNTEISKQPNVKVNCIMNLTGNFHSPTIKPNIELPNERNEIQTLVRNYLSTEEEMNMQILYLL